MGNLMHYAVLDLSRRPSRALMLALLLIFAMLTLVGTLAHARAVQHRLAYTEQEELRQVALTWFAGVHHSVTREHVHATLRAQPGVEAVGAYVDGRVRGPFRLGEPLVEVRYVNVDLARMLPMTMVDGRWLAPDDWRGTGTVERPLAAVVSTRFPHRVGDRLALGAEGVEIRVVGVFDRLDNYAVYLHATQHLPHHFHTVVRVPQHDVVLPDVVASGHPDGFLLQAEDEGLFIWDWLSWRVEVDAALAGADIGGSLHTFMPVGAIIDAYLLELGPRDRFGLWLVVLVLLLTIFGFGSFSAVSAWDRRSEWGIHLAAGASHRAVRLLACFEVVWLAVVPGLVVGGLVWLHGVRVPADALPAAAIDYLRLDGTTAVLGIGVVLGVAVVAALAPLFYLSSRRVVELVRSAI